MNNNELNLLKRRVVAKAWINEKNMICSGEGSRNWSVAQQANMLKLNRVVGFVAQFLTPVTDEETCRVQLLDDTIEYLTAHSGPNRNKAIGYFDTDTETVSALATTRTVRLSAPEYLGYFEQRRDLFVGQSNKFGLKVTAHNEQDESASKMDRFGLTHTDDDSGTSASASDTRRSKYGF